MVVDRTSWTPEAHRALLIAVMTNVTLTPDEWSKVSKELSAKGYSYTQQAAVYAITFFSLITNPITQQLAPKSHISFVYLPGSHTEFHLPNLPFFQQVATQTTYIHHHLLFLRHRPTVHQTSPSPIKITPQPHQNEQRF